MNEGAGKTVSVTLGALALLWLGLLLGVSFLATPVKFLAPSLSLPVALDVGRQTFGVFNPLELLLGVLLAGGTVLAWRKGSAAGRHLRRSFSGALLLAPLPLLLVLLQTLWLLPVLDARVELILQGIQPPPSSLHRLYIGVDLLKLVILAVFSWLGLRAALR